MKKEQIPVIYIISSGHSGSTLLDLMLGSHSKIESVGEIYKLPKIIRNELSKESDCSCGAPVQNCPYWKAVFKKAGINHKAFPNINTAETFTSANENLFSAILTVAGKRVVCDSSKKLDRLQHFLSSPRFDVTIVHLVRDGRAVTYSNYTKATRGKKIVRARYKKFYRLLWKWHTNNKRYESMFCPHENYTLVTYESLVKNPAKTLEHILGKAGIAYEPRQLRFSKHQHHNVSGNGLRKHLENTAGVVPDTRYIKHLPHFRWIASSVLLFADLKKYGYPLWRGQMRDLLTAGE